MPVIKTYHNHCHKFRLFNYLFSTYSFFLFFLFVVDWASVKYAFNSPAQCRTVDNAIGNVLLPTTILSSLWKSWWVVGHQEVLNSYPSFPQHQPSLSSSSSSCCSSQNLLLGAFLHHETIADANAGVSNYHLLSCWATVPFSYSHLFRLILCSCELHLHGALHIYSSWLRWRCHYLGRATQLYPSNSLLVEQIYHRPFLL